MSEEILEGNKLIAEFLGYVYYEPLVHFDDDGIAANVEVLPKKRNWHY